MWVEHAMELRMSGEGMKWLDEDRDILMKDEILKEMVPEEEIMEELVRIYSEQQNCCNVFTFQNSNQISP